MFVRSYRLHETILKYCSILYAVYLPFIYSINEISQTSSIYKYAKQSSIECFVLRILQLYRWSKNSPKLIHSCNYLLSLFSTKLKRHMLKKFNSIIKKINRNHSHQTRPEFCPFQSQVMKVSWWPRHQLKCSPDQEDHFFVSLYHL